MEYWLTLDSIRELDRGDRRLRRLTGVNPPTPREGADGTWQQYDYLEPEIPVAGQGVVIAWEDLSHLVPGRIRGTQTAPIVGTFTEDPTVGPWRCHSLEDEPSVCESEAAEEGGEGTPGRRRSSIVSDGETEVVAIEESGFVLTALLNVAAHHDDFEDPDAPWRVLPLPDNLPTEVDNPVDYAVLAADVAGTPVAIGRRDEVLRVGRALSHLPRGKSLAPGLLVASSSIGGSWAMVPSSPRLMSEELAHKNLTATGLTDEEVAAAGGDEMVFQVASRLERRMPWSSIGRWLRAAHPALGGESPLTALAIGREVDEAILEPFPGADPPYQEWEAEAWACYEAAKAAGLSWVELHRDQADGRWLVQARRSGVDLLVADTNVGLVAGAQLGDQEDGEPEGRWVWFEPTDPTSAPRALAEMADQWLARPGSKERLLARLMMRIGVPGAEGLGEFEGSED